MTFNEDAAWSLECHQCGARVCSSRSSISISVVSFHPERKLWASLPRRTSWNSRKQLIPCAYPKFTTRDALTFSRDRQSMWFDNWRSISKFKFNVYFQIQVFGTMSVQLLFIVVYCAWTPTLDTFWDFSPPLGKKIGSRRRSGRRCKNAGDKAETKQIQHCNVTRREPELIVTTSNIEFWLSHFTQDILKHRRARQWSLSHWAKSYRLRTFKLEDPT